MSQADAERMWDFLCFDFHVLNEVKYFALNNKFIPTDDCYKVENYSAQDVYNIMYKQNSNFTKIEAFKYLIKLETQLDNAIKDLESATSSSTF